MRNTASEPHDNVAIFAALLGERSTPRSFELAVPRASLLFPLMKLLSIHCAQPREGQCLVYNRQTDEKPWRCLGFSPPSMLSQTIVVDGVRYVLTRAVAKSANLSPNYISRFCREALVQAVRHNGMWYVNETSLEKFLADEVRQQEEWKRQLSQQRKHERELAQQAAPATPDATHSTQVKWRARAPTPVTVLPHPHLRAPERDFARTPHLVRVQQAIILAVALTGILFSASALVHVALPGAQQHLIASVREKFPDALASFSNISSRAQLAASSLPWLDNLGNSLYRALCPIFRNCPSAERAATEPAPRATSWTDRQLPNPPQQQTPTRATSKAATSPPAPPRPLQQTIINNPVVERIIERNASSPLPAASLKRF